MSKVLHLTLYLDIGGLERMILLLSREQKALGWEPSVLVYEKATGDLLPQFERAGVPVIFLPKGRGFSPLLPFRILGALRGRGITLIHSHDLGALIYGSLARLASFGRIRLVHTQHSFQHLGSRKERFYERIFPWLAQRLVCVSEDVRRTYLSLGQSLDRLRIVPNGVDFGSPRPTTEEKRALRRSLIAAHGLPGEILDRPWILTLGRLATVKGPQHALRVWREARAAYAVLLCVGPEAEPGFLAQLRAEAPPNVWFPGPTLDPLRWLNAADLFLSSSEFEGMPLAALEAAATGLPMLLSEIPGHSAFSGWAAFFPLTDPAAGGALLARFLSSGRLGEGTGDSAVLKQLASEGGAPRMARRYLEVYGELADASGKKVAAEL